MSDLRIYKFKKDDKVCDLFFGLNEILERAWIDYIKELDTDCPSEAQYYDFMATAASKGWIDLDKINRL